MSAPGTETSFTGERQLIIRKDLSGGQERRLVTGIVLEPETVDSQGDIYSADAIEQAAHTFMAEYRNVGHQHSTLVNDLVQIVESFVAPSDFELGGMTVKAGTWLMTVKVLDEPLWQAVKAGELTGFSIGGFAQRVPIAAD